MIEPLKNRSVDYLIIGQGLAGSLLAWELMRRHCKVLIVDPGTENASQVAAGLINPITGPRLAKASATDMLLSAAKHYYQGLADAFQQTFYVEKSMLRIFRNINEWSAAKKRQLDPNYQPYIGEIHNDINNKQLLTPFGCLEQRQTGYLLTRPLLNCLRNFFHSKNSYLQEKLNHADIQLRPELIWQSIQAKQIIFCEGYQAVDNPWFPGLPLQSVKGEILTIAHPDVITDSIINFGNWLIPMERQQSRVGASFDWGNTDCQPSTQARERLLRSLQAIAPDWAANVSVLDHQANIRPCSRDRLPFIGVHRQYPQLAIFNGFGAKGSLQIPWYCQHFADVLLTATPLQRNCDIARFN